MKRSNSGEDKPSKDLSDLQAAHFEYLSKPMKVTNAFVQKSCWVILFWAVLTLISAGITLSQGNFVPVRSENREFQVWSDIRSQQLDMQLMAERVAGAVAEGEFRALQTQRVDRWLLIVVYEALRENDTIFSKENLLKIQELENHILNSTEYQRTCKAFST